MVKVTDLESLASEILSSHPVRMTEKNAKFIILTEKIA
jgi:hypothetical protein